jgi:hypothetical protein
MGWHLPHRACGALMTTDAAEAEIRRGQRAAAFLEEGGVFREAWDEMEAAITANWRNSPARDSEGRERLWALLRAMRDLEATIQSYVDSGKVVQERIAAEERDRAVNGG